MDWKRCILDGILEKYRAVRGAGVFCRAESICNHQEEKKTFLYFRLRYPQLRYPIHLNRLWTGFIRIVYW